MAVADSQRQHRLRVPLQHTQALERVDVLAGQGREGVKGKGILGGRAAGGGGPWVCRIRWGAA